MRGLLALAHKQVLPQPVLAEAVVAREQVLALPSDLRQ
jgi:hypothetical protein